MINGLLDWGSANIVNDPVLNHPSMQRLRRVKQLGQIDGVNSRAVHTRYDHSGFAGHIARYVCQILEEKGRLPDSKIDLIQHSKIHDCGHPPFSHAAEYVVKEFTDLDHNIKALLLLESELKDDHGFTLKDRLEETGTNPANLRRLIRKEKPGSKICTDKTLGTDKLAYTLMDAVVCGYNQLPPAWQSLAPYLTFVESLGLDIGMRARQQDDPISMTCASQTFYFRMYTDLYLSPESLALERHIQKSIEHAIKGNLLTAEQVWDLGDGALVHTIEYANPKNAHIKKSQEQMCRYTESGNVFQRALAFKNPKFQFNKHQDERVHPLDPDFRDRFLATFAKPSLLSELEAHLEKTYNVPFICSVLPDPEKVRPGDVDLYSGTKLVDTLSNVKPAHYAMLNEHTDSFFAIRLQVPRAEQENIRRKHEHVAGTFYEKTQDIIQREAA